MTWLFSNEEFSAAHVCIQLKDGEAKGNTENLVESFKKSYIIIVFL